MPNRRVYDQSKENTRTRFFESSVHGVLCNLDSNGLDLLLFANGIEPR